MGLRGWRGPVISSAGAFSDAHQDANGLGNVVYCASGHKLFFIPTHRPNHLIVNYDNIPATHALGFEYLFSLPNEFGCFILSPGQSL